MKEDPETGNRSQTFDLTGHKFTTEPERFVALIKSMGIALNVVLATTGDRSKALEAAKKQDIWITYGYQNFQSEKLSNVLGTTSLDPAIRQFFLEHKDLLRFYLDDEFLGDAIKEVGNKNTKPDLSWLIVNYLTRIYEFETAPTIASLQSALTALAQKTYKFSKDVDVGRAKLFVSKDSEHPRRYDEENAIATLDPEKSPFYGVGSDLPNTVTVGSKDLVDSMEKFAAWVQGKIRENSANKNNFYIYEEYYPYNGRDFFITARNGRIELNYTSITYSGVAGILRPQRQEGALGTIVDDQFKPSWYMKPKPENAHEWSLAAAMKLTEMVAQGHLIRRQQSNETDKFIRELHVRLGLAYGPNGHMISRNQNSGFQYGNQWGIQLDMQRYPAAAGVAVGLMNSLSDIQLVRELSTQLYNAIAAQKKAEKILAIRMPSMAKLKIAVGERVTLTTPRTLRWGAAIGLSDPMTRKTLALVVELLGFYGSTEKFIDKHNENGQVERCGRADITPRNFVRALGIDYRHANCIFATRIDHRHTCDLDAIDRRNLDAGIQQYGGALALQRESAQRTDDGAENSRCAERCVGQQTCFEI